jgi:hypothetical protein
MHRKFPTTPPTCFDVTLEDGTTLPIFQFDFLSSLRHHLLCEDLYGDLENLNVNQEDRWLPYQNTSGELMELMDGDLYRRTVLKLDPIIEKTQTNPFTDFIIPIKVHVDKTGCVSNERFSLEPVMISTAVLKNQLNQNATSYFLLGYITDPGNVSSAKKAKANQTKDGRGQSLRDYHACLKVLPSWQPGLPCLWFPSDVPCNGQWLEQ